MKAPLTFYFDFISPYAYLGWTHIHALAARHGRAVQPVPILFAALLDAYGHKGPAEIPPKRVYLFKDVLRTAHQWKVPLGPPPAHPFNPLLALRVASLQLDAEAQKHVIDVLFRAVWGGDGPGVTDPTVVAELLSEEGLDGEGMVHAACSEPAKARVRAATDEALRAGVFGVPSVEADGELFWGCDAFPHMERRLEGADPVDAIDLGRWASLPAQSKRKAAQ